MLTVIPLVLAAILTVSPAQGPDTSMMRPINLLRTAMERFNKDIPGDVFAASGSTIVDNFPPYLFEGAGAQKRWWLGFKAHAHAGNLAKLHASFGAPHDFDRSVERVFFTLPTTWTGFSHGKRFTERGGWAFVLVREPMGWRIKSYAWAVTY